MHRMGVTKWELVLVTSLIKSIFDRDVIDNSRRGKVNITYGEVLAV